MSRPRKIDPQKAVPMILDRIAGGETLVSIADDLGIARRTAYRWIKEADQSAELGHAREAGADALAAQALAIADCAERDAIDAERDGNRVKTKRGDMPRHRRSQVETLLKLAAVFCPAKHGKKAQVEHTGRCGSPIESVTRVAPKP